MSKYDMVVLILGICTLILVSLYAGIFSDWMGWW